MIPMLGGEVDERQQRLAVLDQAGDGFVVLVPYFSAKVLMAASAAARVSACQMSRRWDFTARAMAFGNLFSTFETLCAST